MPMPSKPVIAILILAVAVMAATFWVHLKDSKPTGPPTPPAGEQMAADGSVSEPVERVPPTAPPRKPERAADRPNATASDLAKGTPETPEAQKEAYVAKRVAELQDLGMEDDSESLNAILSELNNEEPDILEAAVEAAVQFGSREAIPRLTEAAAQASDPKEKSAILEAVEFLKLPTLAEALAPTNQPARDDSRGTTPHP
jgi:hypothetical protein